jgi:uncharacterized protein YdaU (DUF1376 family)
VADWMAFNVADYVSNTLHLQTRQHGAYILLICAAWKAKGTLPGTDAGLMAITKLNAKEWREDGDVLKGFLTRRGTAWVHERVEFEWKDSQSIIDAKRKAGKEGARRRWEGRTGGSAMADPSQTHSQNDAPLPLPLPEPVKTDVELTVSEEPVDRAPAPEPIDDLKPPAFLQRPMPGRAGPIDPDWMPSLSAQDELRRGRPDLTPERVEERMAEFRLWCAESNKQTHNPDATWLGFMRKTHVQQRSRQDRTAPEHDPVLAGVSQALAGRSVPPG